jgi:hypothetical protein
MVLFGQMAWHAPQPIHKLFFNFGAPVFLINVMAFVGQTSAHFPHGSSSW